LHNLGTEAPYTELQIIGFGLEGNSSQFITPALHFKAEQNQGISQKNQVLKNFRVTKHPSQQHESDLNEIWGLLVCLCTGVTTRIRLCELISLTCLRNFDVKIASLYSDLDHDSSLEAFWRELCGNIQLMTSVDSPSTPVESFILPALEMLKVTGVSVSGDLDVAWLSRNGSQTCELRISGEDHPWIKVLSDMEIAATFACVSPHCFQIGDSPCQGAAGWSYPNRFRLSTKVDIYCERGSAQEISSEIIQNGGTYWMNSPRLNLLAKVEGVTTDTTDGFPIYRIKVKKFRLPVGVFKFFSKRKVLREDNKQNAVSCIIS
jgi:hypothetical protein